MLLKNLSASYFRMYRQVSVALSPGVNVIIGDNAQGKSSLLEAVAVLVLGQGIQGAGVRECLSWGQDKGYLEAETSRDGRNSRIRAELLREKGVKHTVDSEVFRLGELYRFFPVVVYWPFDAMLVRGEPEARRRLLDGMLGRLSPAYMNNLRHYRRALIQRNASLRKGLTKGLAVWEEELAVYGGKLAAARQEAVKELALLVEQVYGQLSGGRDSLSMYYHSNWFDPKEGISRSDSIRRAFERNRFKEIQCGHTLAGPHRDDLVLLISGREARQGASQGQQKEAALSLRLAQALLVEKVLKTQPLLLLDDIFAELDSSRREWLGKELAGKGQVMVTSSEIALLPKSFLQANTIKVSEGQVDQIDARSRKTAFP